MPKANLSEQLDRAIQALLAPRVAGRSGRDGAAAKAPIAALARVADQLRGLPREDFKAALRAKLEGRTPMASKAVSAPEAKQTATAYLIVKGAARAIEFYKQAFGATETMRMNGPGRQISATPKSASATTTIMLADEFPDYGVVSAETLGGSPVRIHSPGARRGRNRRPRRLAPARKCCDPVQDQFYGERSGQFIDPFGLHGSLQRTRKRSLLKKFSGASLLCSNLRQRHPRKNQTKSRIRPCRCLTSARDSAR